MHEGQIDGKRPRHDRLFELIRQENIADHVIQRLDRAPKADTEMFSAFINEAEHSLRLS